jgi:hypothetical protein
VSGNGSGIHAGYFSAAHLTNSTVSDNGSVGIVAYYYSVVDVTNSTVSGNGSIGIEAVLNDGVHVTNSIVAGNPEGDCVADWGNFVGEDNFDNDGTCPNSELITGLDPVLADNGGPTLTHALLPGSSAIDAAGDCGLPTDQRGRPRNDGACDGGSYEFQCDIAVVQEGLDTAIYFNPGSGDFDLVAGFLSELLLDRDFTRAVCLGRFPSSPVVDTLPEPPLGEGRYYLARGLTSCVGAGYGDSSLTPDPRDDLDLGPCP